MLVTGRLALPFMKLKMKDGPVELTAPALMGVIDLRHCTDVLAQALEMQELGATFVELGLSASADYASAQDELALVVPQVKHLVEHISLYVAVNTTHPEVMSAAAEAGAHLIIDPNALRAPGAVELMAKLKLPVCLVFDQHTVFEENTDPTGLVSEFLYERIDACLNAGIARSALLIDPTIGMQAPIEYRLKMMGRLHTFKSFALPICAPVPRIIPQPDAYLSSHPSAATALAIFGVDAGVSLIRTNTVGELALALDTWQACTKSARPFKLSKLIVKRFLRKKKDEPLETL